MKSVIRKGCIATLLLLFLPIIVYSQSVFTSHDSGSDNLREEVYLSFRYRGVGDAVTIAMYYNENVYLPVGELFQQLGIYYQIDSQNMRIHGHYLTPSRRYEINFSQRYISIDGERIHFEIDGMLIDELDFYLLPELFQKAFKLDFKVDMSNLLLRLNTSLTMPVVEQLNRQQRRERTELGFKSRIIHPLEFERSRKILAGGFLDYSLTGSVATDNIQTYGYTAGIGTEIMGGDLRGNLFGSWSQTATNFNTSGLRWRYVLEDQPWITQFRAGQYTSQGPNSRQFRGVHFTNQPLEPRTMLDNYVIQGNAPSESEVELFINNSLVDFALADEARKYRFVVPLNYGSNQIRIMVYEPDGTVREEDRRLQVPFTFLPTGEFNYHLSAGRMESHIFGLQGYPGLLSTDLSYGVNSWLTARSGGEYIAGMQRNLPFLYGGISARIFDQYLLNVDAAPLAYYRATTSVVYPNSVSWEVSYTNFTASDMLYNISRSDQEFRANLFFPVNIGSVPLTISVGGDRQEYNNYSTNRIRSDIGFRLGRFSFRSGYRDSWRLIDGQIRSYNGRIVTTASYSFNRSPSVPAIIRGTYLRSQLDYSMRFDQLERIDVQLSRNIFRSGSLRISYGRNLIAGFNIIEGGLTFDFNRTRSTTTGRSSRNTGNLRQNIRGSIGYDDFHQKVVFENRQQVGRSAASVRLYVDHNNNGIFDHNEDELIRANAIRLGRSGSTRLHSDGVIRVTQLQQYHRENMEINTGSIYNPLLVPVVREFSFVADPNRFKPMDIPFYISGVIDGKVTRRRGEEESGIGGVRIHLRQTDGDFREIMRTFTDGSYYAMEIPPGRYEAWIDSTQQKFLNVQASPVVMEFEVRALSQGDFLEELDFQLVPYVDEPAEIPLAEEIQMRREELTDKANDAIKLYVSAQEAFYNKDFKKAWYLVNESLAHYETDYGLAIKGSLLFLFGRRSEAEKYWKLAGEKNPDIEMPDTDLLERMIIMENVDLFDLSNTWN